MNCVTKTESHWEIINGFQNFRKDGPIERLADRHIVKNSVHLQFLMAKYSQKW